MMVWLLGQAVCPVKGSLSASGNPHRRDFALELLWMMRFPSAEEVSPESPFSSSEQAGLSLSVCVPAKMQTSKQEP